MSAKQSFVNAFGPADAAIVHSSVGRVGAAGRRGDRREIEAQQDRHRKVMIPINQRRAERARTFKHPDPDARPRIS
jgi:hypothetical protein